ncbi:MAG: hypothetical protein HYX78_15625 [Armatimonadetes bacterium]|nr:hypothetical protein [Armatimonadota bacterium]
MKGICSTCKHTVYCTYRPDGGANMCDEYEDPGLAQEFDWNLRELVELTERTESDDRPAGP